MSPESDLTIVASGVYLVAVRIVVLLIPNVLLSMLGLANTDERWIVIGLIVLVLAGYHPPKSPPTKGLPTTTAPGSFRAS